MSVCVVAQAIAESDFVFMGAVVNQCPDFAHVRVVVGCLPLLGCDESSEDDDGGDFSG